MSKLNVIVGDEVFENWGSKTIPLPEAVAIEKVYGQNFAQFTNDIDAGSQSAKQVLAWSLLRRANPGLKPEDIDIPIGDVRLDLVCEDCGRSVHGKIVDKIGWDGTPVVIDGVTIRQPAMDKDGLLLRFHDDDETPECGAEAEVPLETPSRSDELAISPTSPTYSESDPGNGID